MGLFWDGLADWQDFFLTYFQWLIIQGRVVLLLKRKAMIMDEAAVGRAMARITHEIIERNRGAEQICLLGVKSRGIPLAQRLAENIFRFEGVEVPIGQLDITLHRDDLSEQDKQGIENTCLIPCNLRDKTVIIVDDVLYTGRTARAALEAIFANGRPSAVQLAVLVDRGHRELPIRADYIGKNLPTSHEETVKVMVAELDGCDKVVIYAKS